MIPVTVNISPNKIVQRFYEIPSPLKAGRDLINERLKFLPRSPESGIYASLQQATGYFGIFTTAHRAVVPHFHFKKDFILYLKKGRAIAGPAFSFVFCGLFIPYISV
jgi:hypothetical protein